MKNVIVVYYNVFFAFFSFMLLACSVLNSKNYFANALISETSSSSSSSSSSSTTGELVKPFSAVENLSNNQAVIVGGGPVGLATALMLSNPPHSMHVTVLEKSSKVAKYDAARSYLYNVNPRGLVWFDTNESARNKLEQLSSSPNKNNGGQNIVIVPGDEKVPIKVTDMKISGKVKLSKSNRSFWIPRHQMVELLQDCCKEQNNALAKQSGPHGSIQICMGKTVTSIESTESSSMSLDTSAIVTVNSDDGSCYNAALVVAADGIDSTVRSCLANNNNNSEKQTSWLQAHPKKFKVKKFKSPATGLTLKALQFPPNFALKDTIDKNIVPNSEAIISINGINQGYNNRASLGMLPIKDSNSIRPANVIVRPGHEVSQLKTAHEAKKWFTNNFPRVNFDEIINNEEWERFVNANATAFPYCQYSPGSAITTSPENNNNAGVVLVGDACHAFPPDIGQGINAGLQDVVALDRSLQGLDIETGERKKVNSKNNKNTNSLSLQDALQAYEANRKKEHCALIRIARFGAPYQYRQSWLRDRIGRVLWTMNVAFRMLLNKLSFGLVPNAAMVLLQTHTLSYREVMKRADITVLVLRTIVLSAIAILLKRKFF